MRNAAKRAGTIFTCAEEEEMADIDVERKGPSIWPWIIGLIILALLIWALVELFGEDEAEVAEAPVPAVVSPGPVPADPPPPEPIAQGPRTLADLMGTPAAFIGQPFSTPAAVRVAEVPSDRGFWVEDQGARVFVVLNEGGPGTADVQGRVDERPDLNPGDMVQVTEAVAQDPTFINSLQGPLDDQTRQILQGLPVYLVTDARNIQKM
jgi:hypothetical protein